MVGSEGSLGLITAAAVRCPIKAQEKHLAFLAVDDFSKCIQLLKEARLFFRSSLSGFEVMDTNAQEATFKAYPGHAPRPFH